MTASPEGCGVEEHTPDCLCDVHVEQPTVVTARIPFDHPWGTAIAHYGRWNGTLWHWFELVDKANKALRTFRENGPGHKFERRMPDEVYDFLVEGIRQGKQPTPLKNEIHERFGYTIDKSYVTHLRKRLTERGQL